MSERPFALQEGETLLRDSAATHFLRPRRSLVGRLCRSFLTDRRVILCEAYHDVLKDEEKGLGPVLLDVPIADVADVRSDAAAAEPSLSLFVRPPEGGEEPLVLFFRDRGWHRGTPERLGERDAWLKALQQERRRLGAGKPEPPRPALSQPASAASLRSAGTGGLIGGKYQILKKIGQGGMGLVYQGMDRTLERPVAIKQMRPELKTLPREKSAFLREAKTSASLHHPFIVDIYEVLEAGSEIYLVFEFVDGKTIDQLLQDQERLEPAAARGILREVCEALGYAHERRFAHRDLKPSNIMVSAAGHAKVMDFGIARVVKDTTSRLTSTDTSGTLAYMAPEQELGKSTARSDLFSLGVTAYEMLAGERPFPGPNYYLQKEKMSFCPLSEAAPGLPPGLCAAVERCMHFDPQRRFQSAAEFSRALEEAAA